MALTKIDDRGLKTPIDLLDNEKIRLGTGNDLQIHHDGNNSKLTHSGTGGLYIGADTFALQKGDHSENYITMAADGTVELYHNNSKKLDTYASGVTVYGNLAVNDNGLLAVGDNADLQIYHDGSNSFLTNDTGNLYIQGDSSSTTEEILIRPKAGEQSARFITNGAVELYHDNSKKFETTANGAVIDGGSNVSMDSNGNGQLKVNGSGYSGAIALDGNAMNIYHNSASRAIAFGINETEKMRIDSSGRVKIGTTTEGHDNADDLTIATSGTTGITIRSGTSGAGNIYFSDATSGNAEYDGYISYSQSVNKLQFGTNQNTRMAIDSSGNVGIGTTSPTELLTVQGNQVMTGTLINNSSTSPQQWKSNGRTGTYNQSIMYTHQNNSSGDTNNGIVFEVGRLTDSSSAEIGKFTIATRGGQVSALIDADGIKFNGDTASANGLDDYEEGSWTPTLEGTTTTGSVTYTARVGKYVKIGKVVTWEFYIAFNSGTGAGTFHISGLPYTVANNGTYPAVNIGYAHSITLRSDYYLTGLHASNNNYIYFYERPNGGGSNLQPNYDGAGALIMSGHYEVS